MTLQSVDKRRISRKKWIKTYETLTGFEPTLRTDLPFKEFAQINIQWLREWCDETARQLEQEGRIYG